MAIDKTTKAKVQLILDFPFYASLVLGMPFIVDETIPTACTDGKCIKYNPKFMDTLSIQDITGVLVHEVMHVVNLHHIRRGNRDPKKFNIAADYAINSIILKSGISLPKDALYDSRYDNKSAEEIYASLTDDDVDKIQQKLGSSGTPSTGEVEDGNQATDSEVQEEEQRVKMAVSTAVNAAKQAGKLPVGLDRYIEELIAPKVNWREVLARFIVDKSTSDYTWTKPNKRYMPVYLPSLDAVENITTIVLIVDTSGSIDRELLDEFASEMDSIRQMVSKEVFVIYVDTKVNSVQQFDADDELKLNPKGGGGTSFRPGFKYIEDNGLQTNCVIYFTDGYCDDYPATPDVEVLWAVYNNKRFTPKFGETITL